MTRGGEASAHRVAIIGAGSWGTALACVLSPGGETYVWSRDPGQVAAMEATRHNPRYLTDIEIPKGVYFTADLADAVYKVPIVIMAVPAKAMLTTTRALSGILRTQKGEEPPMVLSAAKGLDPESGRLMSQVLTETLGDRAVVGALSGPNIAVEVAKGMPATTVIACADGARAATAQGRISGPRLRAYTNDDVVGVEVGGAVKNVIAIGTGICDGLEAGDNAKAAIITRGLVEMTRLGVAMGAQARTFAGLTGLGDLVVTCSSPHSRNRQLGMGIAAGKTLEELESSMTMVAEGVNTTREAIRLGRHLDVELPITEALAEILFEKADPMHVAIRLMQRTGRSESEGLGLS
jgi:glycerol-3-phosphate dehydrogenase (NAD(P)+)